MSPDMFSSQSRRWSATRTIASVLGVFAGLSGLDHGFFEILQGSARTHGVFVTSIGPAQRMWVYGTEDAFTLVPNFLVTGILAVAFGTAIIVWSIGFLDRRDGSAVFAGLGAALFLVGGGVAQVAFAALCWSVSRRIGRPPRPWPSAFPPRLLALMARLWRVALMGAAALGILALEIAIFGFVPGVADADRKRYVCWVSLGVMVFLVLCAIVGGFTQDRETEAHRRALGSPLAPEVGRSGG